ncbi:MAG TPA: HAMP domain-containing sensor histidine kinase, partial [Ktedonobacterales bacterium]|nr:HAMP domain-containing sensor histidine kinase [Ktedonobacterales bacterium]
ATERQAQTLARVESLLERAQRQTDRENRIVSDLLDVSRIQAGKLELRTQRCDLLALVREAVEEQRLASPQRAITLALPRGRRRLSVEADADRISQVITNYLTNALKYAPAGPIAVRVERREGAVRVSVRDSGPGLPPAEQERVWERFYRVPDAGAGNGQIGMGIGLFLCKSLVERHGGRVGVESAPGAGATFWLELPLPSC